MAEQEKATTAADSTTPVRADDNAAEGEATTTTAGTYLINRIDIGSKNSASFAQYVVPGSSVQETYKCTRDVTLSASVLQY